MTHRRMASSTTRRWSRGGLRETSRSSSTNTHLLISITRSSFRFSHSHHSQNHISTHRRGHLTRTHHLSSRVCVCVRVRPANQQGRIARPAFVPVGGEASGPGGAPAATAAGGAAARHHHANSLTKDESEEDRASLLIECTEGTTAPTDDRGEMKG